MTKLAYLFPGQGTQIVGMGRDVSAAYNAVRKVYDQADEILGWELSKLCFEGSEGELTQTINSQPAIFVTSLAILEVLKERNRDLRPYICCGLSLGEFSALVCAGALSFESGLKLVRRRAELMEEAARKNPGTMASIIGLKLEIVEEICRQTDVEIANLNSPEQTVISGRVEVVREAAKLAKQKGARGAILLKVSGAFHSRLMQEAANGLREYLAGVEIRKPVTKFITNVTGEFEGDPEKIRENLARQIISPVCWQESMELLAREGIGQCLEIGPGRVLKGLMGKINPALPVINLCSKEEVEKVELQS